VSERAESPVVRTVFAREGVRLDRRADDAVVLTAGEKVTVIAPNEWAMIVGALGGTLST